MSTFSGKKWKILFPDKTKNIVCLKCLDAIFPHKFEGDAYKEEQAKDIAVLPAQDKLKCCCCNGK